MKTETQTLRETVDKALVRAYSLGQTYWQQADSDYISHNRKSDETQARFDAMRAETVAALDVGQWQPIATAPKDGTEFQAWVGHWEPRCRIDPECEVFEIYGRVDYDMDGWAIYGHLTATHWMPTPTKPEKDNG